ncbi:hypothetical protein [Nonomuraea diastatica]|uniref:hypothetical protein n=1 Tax=Nonomuraea diastatica TaxID=1848329 RepID=UPI003CCC83CD
MLAEQSQEVGDRREQVGRQAREQHRDNAPSQAAGLGRQQLPVGHQQKIIKLQADQWRRCRPLSFVLTAGQAGDSPQFRAEMERLKIRLPVGRPRTRPGRWPPTRRTHPAGTVPTCRRRIKAVIEVKADQAANRKKRGSRGGRLVSHDPDLYKQRNTAERCINRIKEWRGLAFRFDKTPDSYLTGLHLRGAVLWIRSLRPP